MRLQGLAGGLILMLSTGSTWTSFSAEPPTARPTPTPDGASTATIADCQPEAFVPGETVLVEPRDEFDMAVTSGPVMGAHAPAGMQLTRWDFQCGTPGIPDTVLEIRQDGVRRALFTHIRQLTVTPDGRQLFFVNAVKVGNAWRKKARLLDLHTWSVVSLAAPDAACLGWDATISKKGIFTLGKYPGEANPQEACLWSTTGQPIAALSHRGGLAIRASVVSFDPPIVEVTEMVDCEVTALNLTTGAARVLRPSATRSCQEVLDQSVTVENVDHFGQPRP